MNQSRTPKSVSISFTLGILAAIFALLAHHCVFGFDLRVSHEDWGLFGDFIGGTLGTIFGLISIFILFRIFQIERDDRNKKEEHEELHSILTAHRDILKNITVNEYRAATQGVETVYSWYAVSGPEAVKNLTADHLIPQITKQIDYQTSLEAILASIVPRMPPDLSGKISHAAHTILPHGEHHAFFVGGGAAKISFMAAHPEYRNYLTPIQQESLRKLTIEALPFEKNLAILEKSFETFYGDRGYLFGHYIRNHFYLLDYLNNLKHNHKERTSKFARSYLSGGEIILIFYNCFFRKSTLIYRKLLLTYDIFDDLELQDFLHRDFYSENKERIFQYFRRPDSIH